MKIVPNKQNSGRPLNLRVNYQGSGLSQVVVSLITKTTAVLVLTALLSTAHADTQAPSGVTGLSGTAISSTSIRLNWNQPWDDQGVEGYNLYRNDAYYQTVYEPYFVDNAVQPKSRYTYSVTAFDQARNFSIFSSTIAVATGDNDAAPPPPISNTAPTIPSNLRVENNSGSEITIAWDGNSVGYNVYRNDAYYTTTDSARFTDTNISSGASYRYDVVGFDPASNFSAHSDQITVSAGQTNPGAQTADQATNLSAQAGNNQVTLTWNGSASGYNVYRNGSYITTVTNGSSYTDPVTAGNTYEYYIVAFDANNQFAAPSNKTSVTVTGSSSANTNNGSLSAPQNLQGQSRNGNSIELSWSQPSSGSASGYNVYRNDSYYRTVYNTSLTDNAVSANATYQYHVVAYDVNNNFSAPSASLSVNVTGMSNDDSGSTVVDSSFTTTIQSGSNPGGALSQPRNLRSQTLNANQVMLYWDAPDSGVAGGYNLYQDEAYIGTIYGNSHQIPWLESGRDYRFHVIAFDTSKSVYSRRSSSIYANTNRGSDDSFTTRSAGSTVPDGYRLVFSDEFQGWNLDSNKWTTRYKWGPDWLINGEKQYYVDTLNKPDFGYNPFSFDGEHLKITATPTPEWLKGSANWQPYLSGVLTTYNKFKMKYGYVEMRAKLPKGKGLWSAFWLLHQENYDRRPEIDVVELVGHYPDVVYQTYHYYNNGNLVSSRSHEVYGPDYSQDFHTYGMKWEPGKITYYVDGRQTHVINDGNVSWEDMYLITNLAVGGWWPGDPDGSTQFPAEMTIDYIRAYQQ